MISGIVIFLNGEEREIGVFATGRRPLVGTRLLEDHELVIQFVENGLVTIDERCKSRNCDESRF